MATYVYIIIVLTLALIIAEVVKKKYLRAGLWAVAGLFVYLIVESVMLPIRFGEIRDMRYNKVIDKLEAIRDAEVLYRSSNGRYAANFDELFNFLDTSVIYLTQTREEVVTEYDKRYRIDKQVEKTFIDTIATVPAAQQLMTTSKAFKKYMDQNNGDYKSLRYVPFAENPQQEFEVAAGTIEKMQNKVPTFEVKVSKEIILYDQDQNELNRKKEAVVGVRGEYIQIGDVNATTTDGNWGKRGEE